MQATVVSKRPPRLLFVALAVALGIVALGAVFAPALLQRGLAQDATYQRLLGYAPASSGSSLAASSAGDARAGQVMIAASTAPAATPQPPSVSAQVAGPSDAPADASTEPASTADTNPNLVGSAGPAMRELNETREKLTEDPLSSFGLGVLPRDAADVTGAPDLERFVTPEVDEAGCTWTKEATSEDSDHDGHPEYVHVRMLGTCERTDDAGTVVATMTVARDIQAWDNDSSGNFNALEARQGLEAAAAPMNGTYRYHAQAVWTLSAKDLNEDKALEYALVTFAGEQSFDRDASGNAEFRRSGDATIRYVNDLSPDEPNAADVSLRLYQTYDLHDDGGREYQGLLTIAAHTVDADHDGFNETATASLEGYEVLDANRDGIDELARGAQVSFNRTDENSNGYAESADAWIYLYAKADPDSNGILAVRRALELSGSITDATDDGNPELVQLTVRGAVLRDADEDGRAEVNVSLAGTFEARDDDSNGIFERATLHLQAEALGDADSDGIPEEHAYATLDALVVNDIQDAYPESVELHFVATDELDLNDDGIVDETRGATADLLATDANSNGHVEAANVTVHASDVRDANHDGIPEYQATFDAYAQATDSNDDGHPEYVNVTARGSAVLDENQDGMPEMTASLRYDAQYVDADSNGVVEEATVTFRAERITYDGDGTVTSHEWISLDYHGEDLDQDGTMDNVSLFVEKHVLPQG